MNNLISELKWRGLFKDTTDLKNFKSAIEANSSFYLGIDPTADSIHIGHMLSINLSRIFARYGLKPVFLIGGATASIGDPSGKSKERNIINSIDLTKNINSITNQIEKICNNIPEIKENYVLENNWNWYMNMDYIKFLRDYGKLINVSTMISKDNVKKRLSTGISYTEFSYMLMQAYDWYELYLKYKVKIQIGGSDQWGNIVTGTEMLRKLVKEDVFSGLTINLLVDKNGNKIGKTSSGEVIWMDENKTSSFKLYQYIWNQEDSFAMDLVKKLTLISELEFEDLFKSHSKKPNERVFQKYLAKNLISSLNHKINYENVVKVSEVMFSEKYETLTKKDFEVMFNESKSMKVKKSSIINNSFIDFVEKNKLINSRRELRDLIKSKTVKINNLVVSREDFLITEKQLLFKKYLILRLSKKNRILLKV